jgi:hypothetical protein
MSNGQIAQLKRSRQPVYIGGVRAPSQLEYLHCLLLSSKNRHSKNGRVVSTKGCVIDTRITGERVQCYETRTRKGKRT